MPGYDHCPGMGYALLSRLLQLHSTSKHVLWTSLTLRVQATIHAADTYRDATPAWPVVGRGSDHGSLFAYATDERTMDLHKHKRGTAMAPHLLERMKAFVRNWYRSKGKKVNFSSNMKLEQARSLALAAEAEAPVLKPKKGMEYRFTS